LAGESLVAEPKAGGTNALPKPAGTPVAAESLTRPVLAGSVLAGSVLAGTGLDDALLGVEPATGFAGRPVAADPNVTAAAEAAVAEPGGAEPDRTEPDRAEPDRAEPDGAEPDGAEPDGAEPDGAKSCADGPDCGGVTGESRTTDVPGWSTAIVVIAG
jgi:hypothetical protein